MVVADQLVQGLQVRPDPAMPLLRSHVPVPLLDLSAGCTVTENRRALIARLAALDPYHEVMTGYNESDLRCFFCASSEGDSHMPECLWLAASGDRP
jgi:hypothetical protein